MAQDQDEVKRILALLVDTSECDQTPEEAEHELMADGVNVTAFLSRVHQAVHQKQKEERLAWRIDARSHAEAFALTKDFYEQFALMTHAELVVEAQRRADQLHFKNLENLTDDDLRSQLADHMRLEELAKKK